MSAFETVAVPAVRLDDGREFISDESVLDMPELERFVAAFPNYWSRDLTLAGWTSPPLQPKDEGETRCS